MLPFTLMLGAVVGPKVLDALAVAAATGRELASEVVEEMKGVIADVVKVLGKLKHKPKCSYLVAVLALEIPFMNV